MYSFSVVMYSSVIAGVSGIRRDGTVTMLANFENSLPGLQSSSLSTTLAAPSCSSAAASGIASSKMAGFC